MQQIEFRLTPKAKGIYLITHEVEQHLPPLPEFGLLYLFIKHTSAALSINENADPSVRKDLDSSLNHIVPANQSYYTHTLEGDDDMPAHVKCSLIGSNLTIPITHRRLNLGTWQGIYLCEFRANGGARTLVATITGE